ncbi:Protein CBG17681 [Caenorhabditis briggsae]|uniref:Protein CBG17681 n=1 Tax=Caenorhabditis briggsae TaxID=6238 RepID=A8XRJ1_CAEBR|nr:Protein CBG17681 [Caenorhabditis briggsae]CAP35265.2 Protein CBG17681 [Caenorhabditis briggsae]
MSLLLNPITVVPLIEAHPKASTLISIISISLKLEKEASEKRCHQLQQDLNELRSKYESNLSETLRLQTPNGKVRQSSSRSERRQTLYKPSPATLANYVEESEVAERLDEANTMICKLESEKQTLQSKWETATESFVEAEKQIKELESSKSVLITEKEQLSKEFDAVRRENEENVEKISKNRKDLDGLLLKIAEYAKEIENRKQEKLTIEEKHGKEMDEITNHHKSVKEELQSQIRNLSASNSNFSESQKEANEKEELLQQRLQSLSEEKSALQKELANKAQLLADAKNDIKECSKTSSELHSKIVEKSEMISTLKKKVEENDAELKIKAELIVSLEQDIAKKAELIKQQAAKLDENVTDKQDEITELKNLNEFYSKQHDEDSHAIANMMNTRQGKLSYVEKIRLDKMEQEKTIIQQRATIARLREANRPVLRSRNQEAAPQ